MQRSVRENIALPLHRRGSGSWGLIDLGRRAADGRRRRRDAPDRRARRRARSAGCRAATSRRSRSRAGSPAASTTMLCFDPTRGIDIRTKQQIYVLLRDLAEAGRGGPPLHLRAQGGPARLRPGDRDLRRPGRGRDRRAADADEARCCGPPTTCSADAELPERSRPARPRRGAERQADGATRRRPRRTTRPPAAGAA